MKLLTVKDLAALLQISERTIYNGIGVHSKNPFPIKPKRIGKLVRFDSRDVEKYIEGLG